MNAYRDQLDVLKIKAEKVNKLENEILKFKEKLIEMDVLKKRKEVGRWFMCWGRIQVNIGVEGEVLGENTGEHWGRGGYNSIDIYISS